MRLEPREHNEISSTKKSNYFIIFPESLRLFFQALNSLSLDIIYIRFSPLPVPSLWSPRILRLIYLIVKKAEEREESLKTCIDSQRY